MVGGRRWRFRALIQVVLQLIVQVLGVFDEKIVVAIHARQVVNRTQVQGGVIRERSVELSEYHV